ncbi:MAG: DUF192 domain-containing protein, partial [Actinomycetota bacterium]
MRRGILAFPRFALAVELPETRAERRRGLLGRTALADDAGMLFSSCRSVHTFGMCFPIMVTTLDREMRVVEVRRLPPRRLLLPRRGVRHVLECGASTEFVLGDRAELRLSDELQEERAEQPA